MERSLIESNRTIADDWTITLIGGEIFMDNLPDSIFDQYREILTDLKRLISKYNKQYRLHINCYTNGIWTRSDRVIKFLQDVNGSVVFGYDSIDRYTKQYQHDLVINNIKLLHYNDIKLNPINILFKPTDMDEQFLDSDDFRIIHEYCGLNYQDCFPNRYNVTNELKINFLIRCIQRKLYNVENIVNLFETVICCDGEHSCSPGVFFHDNDCHFGCHFIRSSPQNYQLVNMDKFDCYSCEYFKSCRQHCWLDAKDREYCYFKPVLQYIKAHPETIQQYEQYKCINHS